MYRLDPGNKVIKYTEHGKFTEYGWQIDHIIPKAKNGSDHIDNLQALHWRTNQSVHEDIRNKPGINMREMHRILCRKYRLRMTNRKPRICVGDKIFTRKMVNCETALATIMSIEPKEDSVFVKWASTGFVESILYDSLLFCPIKSRRCKQIHV